MSGKLINRLYIIIAALAVFYGLLFFWQYRQTAPERVTATTAAGLSRTADRLVIQSSGKKVTLDRKSNKWFVGKKTADARKIKTLLQAMDKMTISRTVSSNPGDATDYGLGDKANSLKIYQKKKLLRTIYFGSMVTSKSYYVKTDSDRTIYEAQGDIVFEVGRPVSDWVSGK